MSKSLEKIKAIVHYICHKAQEPIKMGATQLNKVLWYADCLSFMTDGKPISDEIYIKHKFGPVPNTLWKAVNSLKSEDKIKVSEEVSYFIYKRTKFESLKDPDQVGFLSSEDLKILDDSFDFVCERNTASSISKKTHTEIFNNMEMGQIVPFFACYGSEYTKLSEDEITWAKSRIKEIACLY